MNTIPEIGFLRLSQILGNPKKNIPALIPIKKSYWYAGIAKGIFPKPIKLGPRLSVWRVEDIRKLIEEGFDTTSIMKGNNIPHEDDYELNSTSIEETQFNP